MTQTLYVYWQQLTHRREDESERRDAPVLDLAGCFGNPAIAAGHAASLMRLAEPVAGRPGPR